MAKSTRWAFTVQYEPLVYEDMDAYIAKPHKDHPWDIVAEIGWQDEIAPTTGQKHRQGYLRTVRQTRLAQVKKLLPTAHFEIAKDWLALKQYCKKLESKDPSGNTISYVNPNKPLTISQLLLKMATYTVDDFGSDNPLDRFYGDEKKQYWAIARQMLMEDPELAHIIGQPLPQNLWRNTRHVWIKLAEQESECNSITHEEPMLSEGWELKSEH